MCRIEVGIVPLWQRLPGFGAAYSLRWATGLGITLFDSAEALSRFEPDHPRLATVVGPAGERGDEHGRSNPSGGHG